MHLERRSFLREADTYFLRLFFTSTKERLSILLELLAIVQGEQGGSRSDVTVFTGAL